MNNDFAYTLGLRQLPFNPEVGQVIYVENEYDEEINDFIQQNLNAIIDYFDHRGYDFCYIPALSQSLLTDKDILDYYAPYENAVIPHSEMKSDYILRWMLHPENKKNITPSLLYFHPACIDYDYEEAECQFRGIKITPETNYDRFGNFASLLYLIEKDIDDHSKNTFRFHKVDTHISCSIDINDDVLFDEDAQILVEEIRERYEKLKQKGIKDFYILDALHINDKLSRLYISKDLEFYLIDYKKNEPVDLNFIQKTLFILFLRHPEGIYMKKIVDYKSELEDIYKRFGVSEYKLGNKIESLTAGLSSSLRTHVSKIRGAFVSLCDSHLANNYTIRGKNSEAKKISLPRNLIESECDWILQPYKT